MELSEYAFSHRPSNPIEYPDEVATADQITSGKFFPEDILSHAGNYFRDFDRTIVEKLLNVQNCPSALLRIYRGAPSNGVLNTGDWVSLSKKYAEQYAGDGCCSGDKNAKVYSYQVKAKDLSFDGDSFYEFGYWGEKLTEAETEYCTSTNVKG